MKQLAPLQQLTSAMILALATTPVLAQEAAGSGFISSYLLPGIALIFGVFIIVYAPWAVYVIFRQTTRYRRALTDLRHMSQYTDAFAWKNIEASTRQMIEDLDELPKLSGAVLITPALFLHCNNDNQAHEGSTLIVSVESEGLKKEKSKAGKLLLTLTLKNDTWQISNTDQTAIEQQLKELQGKLPNINDTIIND